MDEDEMMVVMNCGTQGMNKVRVEGRKILERKTFLPHVAVECTREMGEALLKKHSNPNMAIFFRNPADSQHRVEIESWIYSNFPKNKTRPRLEKKTDTNNDTQGIAKPKRKYMRRK